MHFLNGFKTHARVLRNNPQTWWKEIPSYCWINHTVVKEVMTFFVNQLKKLKTESPLDYYKILDNLGLKEKVVATTQPTISKGHISSSHAIQEGEI